jgi:hypothetical protein
MPIPQRVTWFTRRCIPFGKEDNTMILWINGALTLVGGSALLDLFKTLLMYFPH